MKSAWTPEQQAEHRKLMCTALRSGKYEQGRGQLRYGTRFDCLGVACDISGLGKWSAAETYVTGGVPEFDALPRVVMDWLGFATNLGEYEGSSLSIQNDLFGLPFPAIADIIESEPDGLIVGSAA